MNPPLDTSEVKMDSGFITYRRPITSEAIPQNEAPMHNPTNKEQVVYRTFVVVGPNSDVSDGNVKAIVCNLENDFKVSSVFLEKAI